MGHSEAQMLVFAADAILVIHALFVGFVVLGLLCILLGGARGWHWVRNFWFRLAHLLAIAVVVLQSWVGMICPLTIWESALRRAAGGDAYPDTFIGYWLGRLLYYQAPGWVFALVYTAFGALVFASWYWIRPNRSRGKRD